MRGTIVSSVLVAGCALLATSLWLVSIQVVAQEPDYSGSGAELLRDPQTDLVEKIRVDLAKSITFEDGLEPNTTLQEALDRISKQSGLTIMINHEAFKQDLQLHEPEMQPVKLPKFLAMRTDTVLRLLLVQVNAGFVVRNDHVEITTMEHMVRQQRRERPNRILSPVNLAFEKRPLADALQELSEHTGISIVLDALRVEASGKATVTATFNHAPLETVVRVLANQAKLKSVRLDNILFVTTEENGRILQEEFRKSIKNDDRYYPHSCGNGLED